ncbi:MAG TPA: hypothetical protein VF618_28515 [Thermoanaerobaculia bacterium]
MGIGLWTVSGIVAFLLARIVPWGRTRGWVVELVTALVTAPLLGLLATGLDFGGWQELDWRAGAFVVFGTFAAIGLARSFRPR